MADDLNYDSLVANDIQQRAVGNLAGAHGVDPQAAADAINAAPASGVPASVAMHAPAEPNDMARLRDQAAILNSSPAVKNWAAGDPAKTAATQDDFRTLANIADSVKNIPVIGDFLKPGLSATASFIQDVKRSMAGPSRSSQITDLIPGMSEQDKKFGSILEDLYGVATSPISGALNVAARPLSYIPMPKQGGGFYTREEAQDRVANTLGLATMALGPEAGVRGPKPSFKMGEGVAPSAPAGPGDGGVFATTDTGHVATPEGTPAAFATAKDAALWIVGKGRSATQRWEVQAGDNGLYHVLEADKTEPFTEPAPPGVDPKQDAAYQDHAAAGEQALKEAQDAVADSKTQTRAPELTQEFMEQNDNGAVVKIDPKGLMSLIEQHPDIASVFMGHSDGLLDAEDAGQPYEMPQAQYIAATAGKPWADELNQHVAVGDGITPAQARELGAAHNVPGIKTMYDLEALYTKSALHQNAVENFLSEADQMIGGYPTAEVAINTANAVAENGPKDWKEQQLLNAWQQLHEAASLPKPGEPKAEGEPAPTPAEPVDEDIIAQMQDMGISPHDYYSQTGKEFPEPEDLDTSDFTPEEQAQWETAKTAIKAAVPRLVKERFLNKLFKTPEAAGMTAPQFNAYSNRIEKAFNSMVQKLWKQTHDKVKKQYTEEWRQVYDNIYPQVMNEIMAQPAIMAEHALRYSKTIEDDLIKDNALVTNGVPNVYYHGSAHTSTIGTEQNPWRAVHQPVISFSTDPKFANRWMSGDEFNVNASYWDAYSPYNQDEAKTLYVVNLKAKNPADFRKPEDVDKAATWFAKKDMKQFDSLSDSDKKYALQNKGMVPELKADTRAVYEAKMKQGYAQDLSKGNWTMWEKPDMWKDVGWDAAHMVESDGGPLNICVENGDQIYFRYRIPIERPGMKLSTDTKAAYGEHLWNNMPKSMFSAEHGRSADEIATELGYSSGEEMLKEVNALEAQRGDVPFRKFLKDTMTKETIQRTKDQIGDVLSPDKILEDARALFTEPQAEDLLIDEFRQLADIVGKPISKEDIQAQAVARFGNTTVGQGLKVKDYAFAMKRFGDKAQQAMAKAKPDYLEAFTNRQEQLKNFLSLKQSFEFNKVFTKTDKHFKQLAKAAKLSGIEQSTLDAIHGELEKYGYSVPKANLNYLYSKWAAQQEALGNPVLEERPIPPKEDVKKLTVDQFNDLLERVKNMEALGRENQKVLVNGKKEDLDATADAMVAASEEVRKKPRTEVVTYKKPKIDFDKWDADLGKVEFMMDKSDNYDPNGIWNKTVIWGARDAHGVDVALRKAFLDTINKAIMKLPKAEKNAWTKAVAKGHGLLDPKRPGKELNLTAFDVMGLAFNSGSDLNVWHLGDGGWGFDPKAVQKLIDKYITPKGMQFIQDTLNSLQDLWPKIADNEREMSGLVPDKVKATPIMHQGKEYAGGYWPLVKDPRRTSGYQNSTVEEMFSNSLRDAATPTGHLKGRTNSPYAVHLDWQSVLFNHLPKVTKRLAYGQYIISMNKLLRDSRVADSLEDTHGQYAVPTMKNWLHRQVGYRLVDPHALDSASAFMRGTREHTYMTTAAFNLAILAEHASAISQSAALIGEASYFEGMTRYVLNPMGTVAAVHAESPFMTNRLQEVNRELRDLGDDLKDQTKILPVATPVDPLLRGFQQLGHSMLSWVNHYTIAMPTYVGAKSKGLREGMSEDEARRYAEKIVAKSHGTGAEMDLSQMQAGGNEALRLLNMYYSYHGTQVNLIREAAEKTAYGAGAKQKLDGIRGGFWLLVLASVGAKVITDHMPKSSKPWDVGLWTVDAILGGLANGYPVVREGFQAVDNRVNGREWDFNLSPVETEITNLFKASESAAMAAAQPWTHKHWKPSKREIQQDIEAVGFLTGAYPGGAQIGRTAQVAHDIEHQPNQVKNPLGALAYGPSHENPKKKH